MGNGEFAVSSSVEEEWEQVGGGTGRQFRNRISDEQFQLVVLPSPHPPAGIADLIQRSIYPLPNTPRVILLNDREEGVSLLVQQPKLSLRELLASLRLELQLFQIIHQIATTAAALSRRHGPFRLTERMVAGLSPSQILLWVNEAFEECSVQWELGRSAAGEQAMVSGLLLLLRQSCPLSLKQSLFLQPPPSFAVLLEGLGRLIQQERCGLAIQREALGNRSTDPPYPLSPRRGRSGEPVVKLPPKQIKRQPPIPNFIKTLSKKTNPERVARVGSKPSLGKVRSLQCSPTGKLQPRTHGNLSSATTNHSIISWNLSSQGISDLLSSKQSAESKPHPHPHPHPQQKLFKTFSRRTIKLFPEEEAIASGEEREGEITFQKESEKSSSCAYGRPRFSFGSLNSFCKHLSESAVEEGDCSFSVVIHEKQQSMGEMTITEEFSRILY